MTGRNETLLMLNNTYRATQRTQRTNLPRAVACQSRLFSPFSFWQCSTPAFTLRLLVNTVRSDSRQSLSVSPAGSEGAMSWGPLVWKAGLRLNRRPGGRVPKHGLQGALVDLRRLIGRNVVTWGMLATTVDGIRVASLYSLCSAGPN